MAAGLNGYAKAVFRNGAPARGRFEVLISPKPPRGDRSERRAGHEGTWWRESPELSLSVVIVVAMRAIRA